jgi:hypothetical protein
MKLPRRAVNMCAHYSPPVPDSHFLLKSIELKAADQRKHWCVCARVCSDGIEISSLRRASTLREWFFSFSALLIPRQTLAPQHQESLVYVQNDHKFIEI